MQPEVPADEPLALGEAEPIASTTDSVTAQIARRKVWGLLAAILAGTGFWVCLGLGIRAVIGR